MRLPLVITLLAPLVAWSGNGPPTPVQCDDEWSDCRETCTMEHGVSARPAKRAKHKKCMDRCKFREKDCRQAVMEASSGVVDPPGEKKPEDNGPYRASSEKERADHQAKLEEEKRIEDERRAAEEKRRADSAKAAEERRTGKAADPEKASKPEKAEKSEPAQKPKPAPAEKSEPAPREEARPQKKTTPPPEEEKPVEKKKPKKEERALDEWDPDAL